MRSEQHVLTHRIRRLEAERTELIDALAGVVRLFTCDSDQPYAEHAETIAAVRLLAKHGRCEIVKDATNDAGNGWLEAEWISGA